MPVGERMDEEEVVKLESDWLWSVEPFRIWFKYLGVDLFNNNGNKFKSSGWLVLYRLFFLFLTIASQIACLLFILRNTKQLSSNYVSDDELNSDALAWNVAIDFTNYAIHSVGCHLVLISHFRVRWTSLAISFQCVESFLNRNVFVAIRKASIAAILYVIIVVCLY